MISSRSSRALFAAAGILMTASFVITDASAYCLIGVRWGADTQVSYNAAGKQTSGQCISASQMDNAVTGSVSAWRALNNGPATNKTANKRDGTNVVGWANLGGQTLGVTNFLKYDRTATSSCQGQLFQLLQEVDVRLSTAWRWTSGGGQCPCAAGSAYYLDSVAEHEFGHVIGLCHTSSPSALMYPSVAACDHKSSSTDDNSGESALCY